MPNVFEFPDRSEGVDCFSPGGSNFDSSTGVVHSESVPSAVLDDTLQDRTHHLLKFAAELATHRTSSKTINQWDAGLPESLAGLDTHFTLKHLVEKFASNVKWVNGTLIICEPEKPSRPNDPYLPNGFSIQWTKHPKIADRYTFTRADQVLHGEPPPTLEQWEATDYSLYKESVQKWRKVHELYVDILQAVTALQEDSNRERLEIVIGCAVLSYTADTVDNTAARKSGYPLLQWRAEPTVRDGGVEVHLDISEADLKSEIAYFPDALDLKTFQNKYNALTEEVSNLLDKVDVHEVCEEPTVLAILNSLVRDLNSVTSDDPKFSLDHEFVIFTRKRRDPYIRFLTEAAKSERVVGWTSGFYPALTAALTDSSERKQLNPANYTSSDYLYTKPLTPDQLDCVVKALHMPFAAVTGPPGTGKTYVIAAIVEAALARGERILVTSENETALSVVRSRLDEDIQSLSISSTGPADAAKESAQTNTIRKALDAWLKDNGTLARKEKALEQFENAAIEYLYSLDIVKQHLTNEYRPLGPGEFSDRMLRSVLDDMSSDTALPSVDAVSVDVLEKFPLTDEEDRYLCGIARQGFTNEEFSLVESLLKSLTANHSVVMPTDLRDTRDEIKQVKSAISDIEHRISDFVPSEYADVTLTPEPEFVQPEEIPYVAPTRKFHEHLEYAPRTPAPPLESIAVDQDDTDSLTNLNNQRGKLVFLRNKFPGKGSLMPSPAILSNMSSLEKLKDVINSPELDLSKLRDSEWRQCLRELDDLVNETLSIKQGMYDYICVEITSGSSTKNKAKKQVWNNCLIKATLASDVKKKIVKKLCAFDYATAKKLFSVLYADALASSVLVNWSDPLDNPECILKAIDFFEELMKCCESRYYHLSIDDQLKAIDTEIAEVIERAKLSRISRHDRIVSEHIEAEDKSREEIDKRNIKNEDDISKENADKEARYDKRYKETQESNQAAAQKAYAARKATWDATNAAYILAREKYRAEQRERHNKPLQKDIEDSKARLVALEDKLKKDVQLYEILPTGHPLRRCAQETRISADDDSLMHILKDQITKLCGVHEHPPQSLKSIWEKMRVVSPTFTVALAKTWRDGKPPREDQTIKSFWKSSHSSGLIRLQAGSAIQDSDWSDLRKATDKLNKARAGLCVASCNSRAFPRLDNPNFRKNLNALLTAIGKTTKTETSKKSLRIKPELKRAAVAVSKQVPVLITVARRAIELFSEDLLAGSGPIFDLVIVDEASQSPLESVALLLLGKRVLVVGDPHQNAPYVVSSDALIGQLQSDLPAIMFPARQLLNFDFSLWDWANMVDKSGTVTLREHNRCSPAIIELSNKLVYTENNIELLPLKQGRRGYAPLEDILVSDIEIEDAINLKEVEAVAKAVAESCQRTKPNQVGVIILAGGKIGAAYHKKLLDSLMWLKVDTKAVKISNSSGFQGDERDIIVLAFCATTIGSDGEYKQPGGWDRKEDLRSLNVAVSRAREKLILVRSVGMSDLRKGDLRATLLSHCASQNATGRTLELDEQLSRCLSHFEKDVVGRLHKMNFIFEVNEKVKGGSIGWRNYMVDISFTNATGQKVGVELDGAWCHTLDSFEADWHRQRRLESAGWVIIRIGGRKYYSNPEGAIANLIKQLADHKVTPSDAV